MICSSCGSYCSTSNCKLCGIQPVVKKKKRIAPVGQRLAEELKLNKILLIGFLKKHPKCAVFPQLPSIEAHHSKGRGKFLNDVTTWVAVSREGHQKIELNPEWAREKGFTKSRLT